MPESGVRPGAPSRRKDTRRAARTPDLPPSRFTNTGAAGKVRVDPRPRWSHATNLRYDAGSRSMLYVIVRARERIGGQGAGRSLESGP